MELLYAHARMSLRFSKKGLLIHLRRQIMEHHAYYLILPFIHVYPTMLLGFHLFSILLLDRE